MNIYLAITPKEAQQLPSCPLKLAHIAYAIDESGLLSRSCLSPQTQGGLLGLSDRCRRPLKHADALLRTIVSECAAHQFDGVLADFETADLPDRVVFLDRLGTILAQQKRKLYVPQLLPAPCANVLISTAISGGSLQEMLQGAQNRYGAARIALDLERLMMDFPLPCPGGRGRPMPLNELQALQKRRDISTFYSRELAAQYFTYSQNGETHFVLFDNAQTLKQKLALGERLGIQTAFVMYPEVKDLLPELFRIPKAN